MAIEEHLEQVQKGLETLNLWRAKNPGKPDFSGANLSRAKLNGLFEDAIDPDLKTLCTYLNLCEADFTGADLTEANLTGANLTGANLTKANLSGACGVNLSGVNELSGTIKPDGTIISF